MVFIIIYLTTRSIYSSLATIGQRSSSWTHSYSHRNCRVWRVWAVVRRTFLEALLCNLGLFGATECAVAFVSDLEAECFLLHSPNCATFIGMNKGSAPNPRSVLLTNVSLHNSMNSLTGQPSTSYTTSKICFWPSVFLLSSLMWLRSTNMSIRYIGPYMHRVLVQPSHTHVMTSFRDSMAFSSVILSGLSSDVCFLIS